jgi:hypothetical protein
MSDAELRIIEFLMTSDATRLADLPDWLLALLEEDNQQELRLFRSKVRGHGFSWPLAWLPSGSIILVWPQEVSGAASGSTLSVPAGKTLWPA